MNEVYESEIMELGSDIAPIDVTNSFLTVSKNYYCSMSPKTSSKEKMFHMLNGNHPDLRDKNEPFNLVNVAAFPGKKVDDYGNVESEFTIMILMDDEGNCYKCASLGVLESLQKMFLIFGYPDNGNWEKKPICVQKTEFTTGTKHRMMQLELVMPSGTKGR